MHCPAHDDRNPSLTVQEGRDGKVLVRCHAGCEQTALLDALRQGGLWPRGERAPSWTAGRGAYRRDFNLTAAKVANPANAHGELALRLWRAAGAANGTLVEHYLTSRGLPGPVPESLRFAPSLAHGPSGQALPAMIAAVTRWPSPTPIAVHRTFLRTDGAAKASVEPPRMALGPVAGSAVRLAAVGDVLVIGEGIESVLSVQMATGLPGWAALSASNLLPLVLPPLPLASEVVIAVDADPAGLRAACTAAERWSAQGRRVRLVVPPAGMDMNDVLNNRECVGDGR